MKKFLKRIIVLMIMIFVISGCGNSNSIKGTWNYYSNNNISNDIYYTFNRDNTGSYAYSGNIKNFTYEDRGTKIIITFDGDTSSSEFDYSISDNILTIKDSYGANVTYKRK